MLFTKTNPVGVDVPIEKLQTRLHNRLNTLWAVDVDGYGRVYKNSDKDGVIRPRFYTENGEYRELLINDDSEPVHFFFVSNDEVLLGNSFNTSEVEVDVIFVVNDLRKLKPNIVHYPDEEVKEDVRRFIKTEFQITAFKKGIDALDGFTTDNIDFIYKYHILKVSFRLIYKSIKCNV